MSLRPPWVSILLALALVAGAVAYLRERDARIRASAVASERIKTDSTVAAELGRALRVLRDSLERTSDTVRVVVERWQARPGSLPAVPRGLTAEQLDSVLAVRDSIHAATVVAGDQLARQCSILERDCATFRTLAEARFARDSSQLASWRSLYESSRQRRFGLGGSIGLSGVYPLYGPAKGTVVGGPGATVGLDFRF